MDCNLYLENLEKKFNQYFTIEKNIFIKGIEINIFAKYFEKTGRTLITQRDVIDAFENYEYCFIKTYENISLREIIEFEEFLKHAAQIYVKPHSEHMCTHVTGIMVSKGIINDECIKEINKFKYSKSFKFMLHGWCDVRLIVADLFSDAVITNKAGKSVKKVYEVTP
ncbi:hypothetical protein SAMN05443428_10339 [Caloramator quimbayensis]|uniref:DUF8052 domain-containing protein n=1 Tax=Caloramator quimbayensis TaxID=1147123 RepID=A0A1T4WPQ7_9CLOT|nr:hypothetical protein [Caloramator quimbayensis]SKA79344.1 hypothetical protein SAMN05443428_10339 [Caloramator quimbayensis]